MAWKSRLEYLSTLPMPSTYAILLRLAFKLSFIASESQISYLSSKKHSNHTSSYMKVKEWRTGQWLVPMNLCLLIMEGKYFCDVPRRFALYLIGQN